jgi:hypothetical protein
VPALLWILARLNASLAQFAQVNKFQLSPVFKMVVAVLLAPDIHSQAHISTWHVAVVAAKTDDSQRHSSKSARPDQCPAVPFGCVALLMAMSAGTPRRAGRLAYQTDRALSSYRVGCQNYLAC